MLGRLTTIITTLHALRALRGHDRWSRSDVLAYQATACTLLREFAYQHSPFYRVFHRGFERAPLAELPVLTKAAMMDHFDDFITDRDLRLADVRAHLEADPAGRFRGIYEVVTTSGSTGNPGIFLYDAQEWTTIIASFARAREWAGLRVDLTRRSPMAVVSSTNERNVSARVGKAADTPFIPTLRLDAVQPIPEIVAALNDWQPEVLVAYASMAYFLAHEQAAGALAIHPRAVFTSSEVLTPSMRQRIEDVWGNVVFNEYAATETASIAAEDTGHHGMHLFEDLLIVENVDAHNQPVPPGTFGDKLLVTVLFSRTQPLIRYEISDRVRFAAHAPACYLPFQIIDGIQGREEDILVLEGRDHQPVSIHPNVFHDAMDTIPSQGWQIIQEVEGLRVLVVPSSETSAAVDVEARLATALAQQGVVPVLRVETVAAIQKAASGKSPLIKALAPARTSISDQPDTHSI